MVCFRGGPEGSGKVWFVLEVGPERCSKVWFVLEVGQKEVVRCGLF